jgi:hypothetical protein
MSKLEEHAAYLTQDPENEGLVIFNIPIRINKSTVDLGAIEMVAAVDGWTPNHPLSAPEFCIEIVKCLSRQKIDEAIRLPALAEKNAEIDAIIASIV